MSSLVNTSQPYVKPGNLAQVFAISTVQASAADATLVNGILTLTGGFSINTSSVQTKGFTVVPYTVGIAGIYGINMASITVADSTTYTITAMTLADQQVYPVAIISNIGSTAASIVAQLNLAINNNSSLPFTSAIDASTNLVIYEKNYITGGISFSLPNGATVNTAEELTVGTITGTYTPGETLTQATSGATATLLSVTLSPNVLLVYNVTGTFDTTHVVTGGTSGATSTPTAVVTMNNQQASGTPQEVATLTSNANITSGQFRKYIFSYHGNSDNSMISGIKQAHVLGYYMVNELATNFAALDTQIKAIMAGTYTPVSAYLGA